MPSPLLFSDESALRLRAMLKGVTERDQPAKPDRGRVRVPTLVRALSATAVGGAELGGDQCYDAVVLNVNSLVADQAEAAPVWLTILDGGTTASPVTVAAPVEGNAYYGLFAGNFDPDPTGTPDPRPRVFAVAAGSGGTPAVSAWKEPVRVATTATGTLASAFENGDTVDGVTLATGDRILLKNQSTGAENGIYTVNATGAPTRATDADAGSELVGAVVYVSEGTANADTVWGCTTNATITLGTTALAWAKLAPTSTALTASTTGSDGSIDFTPYYSITSDNTWQDTGRSITLPSSGTYLVWMSADGVSQIGSGSTPPHSEIWAKLAVSGGADISGELAVTEAVANTSTDGQGRGHAFGMYVYTASGSVTLKCYAQRNNAGAAWEAAWVTAKLGYLKIA